MTESTRWSSTGTIPVGDNHISDDNLDQVIEDSFPASDPPSHTPTTGYDAQDVSQEQPRRYLNRRVLAMIGGTLVSLAAVLLVWRRLT